LSELALRDPGPMARYEERTADPSVPMVVFQRLAEGETLKDIAKSWGVPVGLFTQWYAENHAARLDAAYRVRADQLANEALVEADAADEDNVAAQKLRVDTRLKLAAQWDRSRYGSKDVGNATNITVVVDRSCGGAVEIEAGGIKAHVAIPGTEASRGSIHENSKGGQ
jgi:hypothetical protein